MRRIVAAVLLGWACLSLPVAAQDLPALFHVIGVAEDDVLNIRQGPSASAEAIGSLPPIKPGLS